MRCFVACVVVVIALVIHHSTAVRLCGKHLVIHVGNVCAATDCGIADETMPTSSFSGKETFYRPRMSPIALFPNEQRICMSEFARFFLVADVDLFILYIERNWKSDGTLTATGD